MQTSTGTPSEVMAAETLVGASGNIINTGSPTGARHHDGHALSGSGHSYPG